MHCAEEQIEALSYHERCLNCFYVSVGYKSVLIFAIGLRFVEFCNLINLAIDLKHNWNHFELTIKTTALKQLH